MADDDMVDREHKVTSLIQGTAIPGSVSDGLTEDNGKQEEKEVLGTGSAVSGCGALSLKLFPVADELPHRPPPANECNYTHYYALDVGKPHHDQYLFRHANGLCVIGLAPSHAALNAAVSVTDVDFNVGKKSRADTVAMGKRKKNAMVLEKNSALCKVIAGEDYFVVRCCVRGSLLEVNHRLIKDPQLLISHRDTEGHIAIIMPKPEDWAFVEKSFLTPEQYREQRRLSL